ncbi:MAG: molybdate ABC transporter substrate-binding protein [Parahaliea sp.]
MRLTWLLCLLFSLLPLAAGAGETLRVAVAANFRAALEALNPDFEGRHNAKVILSSASTGVLYNQIAHGAPFDLLLAADVERPAALEAKGLVTTGLRRCYARGQLVLLGADSLSALTDPNLSLAIANPDTAPYGRAAVEVLARPDFAAGKGRRQVQGSNIVQSWQFWHSGAANLALVPRSLAGELGIAIPGNWHSPIEQQAVVLRRATNQALALAYLDWLTSATIQQAIRHAGYSACP